MQTRTEPLNRSFFPGLSSFINYEDDTGLVNEQESTDYFVKVTSTF